MLSSPLTSAHELVPCHCQSLNGRPVFHNIYYLDIISIEFLHIYNLSTHPIDNKSRRHSHGNTSLKENGMILAHVDNKKIKIKPLQTPVSLLLDWYVKGQLLRSFNGYSVHDIVFILNKNLTRI